MEFIVGEKFINIGDFIFSIDNPKDRDYYFRKNTLDIKKLNPINIVYFHTIYAEYFFDKIKNLDEKFIIFTHNSDNNINNIKNLPNNVLHWYAQNVNCKDDRLESLPIGLENSVWYCELKKPSKIINKLNTQKNIYNLVYMNHDVRTNIIEREPPYEILSNKKFVTSELGYNGQDFDNYIDNVYNHKFVICPEGNGIDTHRTWECLYLGSIPIEKRNINNQFYTDLPICFVDSWEEVTEDFLNKEYNRIINTTWNLDKLDFNWWKNKIRNEYLHNTL